MHTIHMLHQIADLGTILIRQAIPGGVGDVHDGSTRFDHRLYHTSQVLVLRTSRILAVELHVLYESLRVFSSGHGTLDNLLSVGVEFIFDVRIRRTDTGVDASSLGEFQSLRRGVNIFFYRTGQGTNRWPCNGFGNLYHTFEISGT